MKYGKIPSIDSGEMWKSILIWVIPLTTFLLSMYVIAFTEGSLAWIVCTMGTMMHPIIAISLLLNDYFDFGKFVYSPREGAVQILTANCSVGVGE